MTEVAQQQQQQWTYDEVAITMAQHLHAYAQNNGPDLEAEDLAIPCDAFSIEKRKAKWTKVKRDKLNLIGARFEALRPKIEEAKRKLVAKPKVSWRHYPTTNFFAPATQPTVEHSAKDNAARKAVVAKFVGANSNLAVPKPKPAEEEEPTEEPEQEEPTEEAVEGEIITSTQIALPTTSTAAKAVALLNQKHHVIGNYGNKCVILSWELWEINRNVMIPTFQRFEDFTHRYMNRYVSRQTDEGSTKVPAGKVWLNHPDRKTYDSVAF